MKKPILGSFGKKLLGPDPPVNISRRRTCPPCDHGYWSTDAAFVVAEQDHTRPASQTPDQVLQTPDSTIPRRLGPKARLFW
jgi:hypothetical protein